MDLDDLDKLWEATHSGAPGARDALGRALSRELCQFFANCFDTATAEDLAQATIVVIWQKFDEFQPKGPSSFRKWVFTVAGYKARSRSPRRELARRAKLWAQPQPLPRTSPGSMVLRVQRHEIIAEVLPQLSEAHRRAVMSVLAGDDHRAIAAREGITVSSARVRLHRAIQGIRRLITARGVTPAPPS